MNPPLPSRPHRGTNLPHLHAALPEATTSRPEETWWIGAPSAAGWSARDFWTFQIIFWLLSVLSLAFMIRTFHPVENATEIIAGRVLTGFLLTLFLHYAYQQPAIRTQNRVAKWIRISSLTLAVCIVSSLIWMALIRWVDLPELEAEHQFLSLTISRMFALLVWNSTYFGIEIFRSSQAIKLEAAQAKFAARSAELRQLQAQLNPHFLFNALNTIKASAANPAMVEEVTQNLADFLRFSLQESRPLEPLSRELESLGLYFNIQRVRFGSELECRMEIAPSALEVMVPPMLVQPLLENAFKYGPQTSPTPLQILVKVTNEDGWLELEVTNSGTWIEAIGGSRVGTGLSNLRRRLHLLLGPAATLRIFHDAERVTVRIRIPVTTSASHGGRLPFGSTPPIGRQSR